MLKGKILSVYIIYVFQMHIAVTNIARFTNGKASVCSYKVFALQF
jgi:hypothetical protein